MLVELRKLLLVHFPLSISRQLGGDEIVAVSSEMKIRCFRHSIAPISDLFENVVDTADVSLHVVALRLQVLQGFQRIVRCPAGFTRGIHYSLLELNRIIQRQLTTADRRLLTSQLIAIFAQRVDLGGNGVLEEFFGLRRIGVYVGTTV